MISPIAFHIGSFPVRWYSLAYLFGFLGAWALASKLSRKVKSAFTPELISDFVVWAMLGVILGARLGYVLFYNFSFYLHHPLQIFAVWQGGMSFHGGFLGLILAAFIFVKLSKIPLFAITDILAMVSPLGLFLGRCANFINGELYGRVTDVPWAIVFAGGGDLPRHPSQLYEAVLEGLLPLVVFIVLWWFVPFVSKHKGFMGGLFLVWYACARIIAETFRQPDLHIGFIGEYFTMGQILSLPMLLIGIGIVIYSVKRKEKND